MKNAILMIIATVIFMTAVIISSILDRKSKQEDFEKKYDYSIDLKVDRIYLYDHDTKKTIIINDIDSLPIYLQSL